MFRDAKRRIADRGGNEHAFVIDHGHMRIGIIEPGQHLAGAHLGRGVGKGRRRGKEIGRSTIGQNDDLDMRIDDAALEAGGNADGKIAVGPGNSQTARRGFKLAEEHRAAIRPLFQEIIDGTEAEKGCARAICPKNVIKADCEERQSLARSIALAHLFVHGNVNEGVISGDHALRPASILSQY